MSKKFRPVWDPEKRRPVRKEIPEKEQWGFDFGESVGMIVFGQWFPALRQGHQNYMTTFNFPIRLKFIESPEAPEDKEREWHGMNLPQWIRCAKELEQEGVRAIVTGCGMIGKIQRELSESVTIPVFTSTILFVPLISRSLKRGQKVGILTASAESLTRWDNLLLRECGVDESIPIAITGMTESDYCGVWWSQLNLDFNPEEVERAIVNVAKNLVSANPDIGAIVCECTEMPSYSEAIRGATGLPVFDAVDMVKCVYSMVRPQRVTSL